MRLRVVGAVALLIAAKVITVYIPIIYKHAVDALSAPAGAIVLPLGLLLAYGGARILAAAFAELREMAFARVAQNAIHVVALETFRHLHRLSLRFHLERQTGGLSRAIERGTNGIDNLLHYLLFQIVPTVFEITLVAVVLWQLYDVRFAAITLGTIVGYVAYTLAVTQWRIKFRRQMVEAEGEANTKAIDSLLNYETVKYFGNEEHEARRFDRALAAYEKAGIKSANSLSLLNAGQGLIIAVGVTLIMILAGLGVVERRMTLGDFVLVNAYLIQLYMPLNFLGMVYRELRQAMIDMQAMFHLLEVNVEVPDAASGCTAARRRRPRRVPGRHLRLRYAPADPQGPVLHGAGRQDGGDRRAERGRQVDHLAAAVPLLRRRRGGGAHRRPGRARRDAGEPARLTRHRPAGHGAVQRHDLLQHRLRPAGGAAVGDRGGGEARAHPRLHHDPAGRLPDPRRRARPQAVGRRAPARGDRAHHPEAAADPAVRRGDLGAWTRAPRRASRNRCARSPPASPR